MTRQKSKRSRAGWSGAETERLFELAKAAQTGGQPLKSVFDALAAETGRKPNSVRNYYYACVRDGSKSYAHRRAFLPFTEEEAAELMEQVLSAKAQGESVRSCTLRLANGNDKEMLRYQNKYRAMLKNRPELVRRIVDDMQAQGKSTVDPYRETLGKRRVGRPQKSSRHTDEIYRQVLSALEQVEGLDVHALLEALGRLAVSAARGAQHTDVGAQALRQENEALAVRLSHADERYRQLLQNFTQLIRINSEFLSLNSVVKVSNLSGYIRELENNVKSCELLMPQTAEGQ